MSRSCTHVQELLPSVMAMKGKGYTYRQIAHQFSLSKNRLRNCVDGPEGNCAGLRRGIFLNRKAALGKRRQHRNSFSTIELLNSKCRWSYSEIFNSNMEGCESQVSGY